MNVAGIQLDPQVMVPMILSLLCALGLFAAAGKLLARFVDGERKRVLATPSKLDDAVELPGLVILQGLATKLQSEGVTVTDVNAGIALLEQMQKQRDALAKKK